METQLYFVKLIEIWLLFCLKKKTVMETELLFPFVCCDFLFFFLHPTNHRPLCELPTLSPRLLYSVWPLSALTEYLILKYMFKYLCCLSWHKLDPFPFLICKRILSGSSICLFQSLPSVSWCPFFFFLPPLLSVLPPAVLLSPPPLPLVLSLCLNTLQSTHLGGCYWSSCILLPGNPFPLSVRVAVIAEGDQR